MAFKNRADEFRYNNKYQKEHYDRTTTLLPVGEKEHLKKVCKEKGFSSVNEFINTCITEKLASLGMEFVAEE